MDLNNAIEVKNITKTFKVYYDKGNTIKEQVVSNKRRKYEKRQVLKGISFEVKKGEAIGLIGHNGCGKSTILKLLTKIMYPDSGSIEIQGRISSLIELGAGFHPDMSGRENIYINASIFGLSHKEIDKRINNIIKFSELEEYIDNPVRTYSSGMYMRLAFSVAINVDADVLLIDEILAVGDANFQSKCFDKLKEIKAKGTTIVIVSHALGQIEEICEKSYWIHDGIIRAGGEVIPVHNQYLEYMENKRNDAFREEQRQQYEEMLSEDIQKDKKDENDTGEEEYKTEEEYKDNSEVDRWGNKKIEMTGIMLLDELGSEQKIFLTDDSIKVEIKYRINEKIIDPAIAFAVYNEEGVMCYGTNTRIDGMRRLTLKEKGKVVIELKDIGLLPGKYFMDCAIESENGVVADYYRKAKEFYMHSKIQNEIGVFRIKHEWKL